ncbi:hypothetical protein [Lentzea sp. E54]|uniref:hypothetical protein n=1 Tax=Lentzea xerophila TaxID=3435883 RepID=UPI003DA27CAA
MPPARPPTDENCTKVPERCRRSTGSAARVTFTKGSSMIRHEVGPDYEETVGAINRYREENDGVQPGDPARAARVLPDVVASNEPPRRLVLGAAAVETVLTAEAKRTAETEKWAAVSASADFPADDLGPGRVLRPGPRTPPVRLPVR